jgi:hypothetical protein
VPLSKTGAAATADLLIASSITPPSFDLKRVIERFATLAPTIMAALCISGQNRISQRNDEHDSSTIEKCGGCHPSLGYELLRPPPGT